MKSCKRFACLAGLLAALLLFAPAAAPAATVSATVNDPDQVRTESLQLQFAKLQLAMAQSAKDGAMDAISKIQQTQQEQTQTQAFIDKARELRHQAVQKGGATAMPADMKAFMDQRKLAYDRTGGDNDHNPQEWDVAISSLKGQQDILGQQLQEWMIWTQDYIKQYNAYLQGVNSSLQSATQTLTALQRGMSLYSSDGSVQPAPIATSALAGVLLGMLIMRAILRRKDNNTAPQEDKA